jgi:hypothetical protein
VKCLSRGWTCPARRSEPAGTECCVVRRRRRLRSVHREREAMRWSLERKSRPSLRGPESLESSTVWIGDDDVDVSSCKRRRSRRGQRASAHAHGGTRKPGRPRRLHRERGRDEPLITSRRCERVRDCSERTHVPTVIPRNEGNEVTREGRRGVGAPHSTDEAGEPTRGTPWREGKQGAGRENRWRER